MEELAGVFRNFWRLTLTILQSLWLFLLYFAVGYVMVGSLGSLQLRDALEAEQQGATYDEVASYKTDFETRVQFIRNTAYRRQDALYEEVNALESNRTELFQSLIELAQPLNLEAKVREKVDSEGYYSDGYYFGTLENIRKHCDALSAEDESYSICIEYEDYQSLSSRVDAKYDEIDSAWEDTEDDSEVYILDEISKLRNSTPFSELFTTVQFMDDFGFSSFLRQPRELLVLQLTMVMGTLGSLVTMTWLFIHRDSKLGIRRTLFLPLVGSVSAFIIFVFFKAGQLTISSGPGESSLSPFFLSFVGIISGLLSERAYARMELVGKKFFTVEEKHPRWGIHLKPALEQCGIGTQELATHTGMSEKSVQDIIDEVKPASDAEQSLIAACLRTEIRQLFTDEAPKEQKKDISEDNSEQQA